VSKKETPPWLDFVQRFERAIGEPVESWVRSDAYFDLMTQMNRARQRFTKGFEDYAEQWLHMFNLPAASDVRRLREQLSRLERTVERMSKELDDQAEPPPPPPRKRPPARPKVDGAGGE
jgi:uncharacterized membrane protein YccC